ncbi:MAG: CPBP family intramembrane metalloprotease, partial [Muribaculaceae bacterium]|nr:CPBP family intramembrane metalloprotease [Muribaculaceae bacterium]
MKNTDLVLTLGQRLSLLACIFIVCYVLTAGMAYMLGRVITENAAAAIRITTMVQDVMAFVVPAVATACVVTRRPADLLCIRSLKGLWTIPILVAVLILSIPAQEALIEWNNNISLPSEAENFFRSLEDAAASSMRLLIADTSVPSLIMNILIIGLAAGFSEELLFRGCFQRLLVTGGVNVHVAIWTVAAVFSAMHLQAYGFVPRMLLG